MKFASLIFFVGFWVVSCASKAPASSSSAIAKPPAAETPPAITSGKDGYNLVLSGKAGAEVQTSYHSHSSIENFEDSQKTRDHQEVVDFLVSTKFAEVKDNQITVRTKTIKKDGTSSLHDYAFPELDETIDFIYSKKAKVLSAEPYPRESIFFLPPVSLPDHPVKVGDTWTMNHAWISSNQALPLDMDLVTIFKGVVSCGEFGKCADLEVSGRIDVANEKFRRSVTFDSRLWGRMLFSLDRGDVVWSEVRSHETFKIANTEMRVLSCMVSQTQPTNGRPDRKTCEPSLKAVTPP